MLAPPMLALLLALLFAAPAVAAPGDLDPTFADHGVYRAPLHTGAPVQDGNFATVDAQGRVVMATTHIDDTNRRHLDVRRLTTSGTVDWSLEIAWAGAGAEDAVARGIALAPD